MGAALIATEAVRPDYRSANDEELCDEHGLPIYSVIEEGRSNNAPDGILYLDLRDLGGAVAITSGHNVQR
jgi:hypothetical protein